MEAYSFKHIVESFVENPSNYEMSADLNLWDKTTKELQQTISNISYDSIAKTTRIYEKAGYEVTIHSYNIYIQDIDYIERYSYTSEPAFF
jgi:hypothetical protein